MQVAIQAGAAFTDAGRLLTSVQRNASIHAGAGVQVVGHRRYKQVFKPVFDGLGKGPVEIEAYQRLKGILPDPAVTDRVVYASNHFLGEPSISIQEGQLYPQAGPRMSLLERAFHGHEIQLYFALKNLASFIPNLLTKLPEQTSDEIVRNTDLSYLSWISVIEDIRDLAPGVQITLWCDEDTPLIWGDIVRAVADLPEESALSDENDLLLSLLDETGQGKVTELAQREAPLNKSDLHNELAHLFEEHALHDEVEEDVELPGWTAEIVEAFSDLYEHDVESLSAMPGVKVLKP